MRLLLIIGVFIGMMVLCVIGLPYGGAGGLVGGALGFLLRLGGRGLDWKERVGNAYVGALMGMPVGLLAGGFIMLGMPYIIGLINTPQ
jgi:hypothetical protein